MLKSRPGSLIVVGVPNNAAEDDVCMDLDESFKNGREQGHCSSNNHIVFMTTPQASSPRVQQRLLADLYCGLPLSKLTQDNGTLNVMDFPMPYGVTEPIARICGIIGHSEARYYVVRSAHLLRPPGSKYHDGVNQLHFFIEMARQASKTHVLFVRTSLALEWKEDSTVADDIATCIMRPYAMVKNQLPTEFRQLLKTYDSLIPREAKFSLLRRSRQMYPAVEGCPYRLKHWIAHSIQHAIAHKKSTVSWEDFCARQPTKSVRERAKKNQDAMLAHDMEVQAIPPDHSAKKPKGNASKPFQPSLTRDPVPSGDAA